MHNIQHTKDLLVEDFPQPGKHSSCSKRLIILYKMCLLGMGCRDIPKVGHINLCSLGFSCSSVSFSVLPNRTKDALAQNYLPSICLKPNVFLNFNMSVLLSVQCRPLVFLPLAVFTCACVSLAVQSQPSTISCCITPRL